MDYLGCPQSVATIFFPRAFRLSAWVDFYSFYLSGLWNIIIDHYLSLSVDYYDRLILFPYSPSFFGLYNNRLHPRLPPAGL